MVAATTSLRRDIANAGDLKTVVRTMKASAAAAIGQYERSVDALADYTRTVELGLSVCLRQHGNASGSQATLTPEATAAAQVVVFGSDQGLVGRFNAVVVDHALVAMAAVKTPVVWAVGARARALLEDAGVLCAGAFEVPSSVAMITRLVTQILSQVATEQGDHGRVTPALTLFYNQPKGRSGYAPVGLRLLPLDQRWQASVAQQPWPAHALPEVLGASATALRAFVREHLFVSLFQASAASLASENASRLAAMQRADSNIAELLQTLQTRFHRLRQSGIDEELFDVVAGFDALQA